jgi:hypothetical protein
VFKLNVLKNPQFALFFLSPLVATELKYITCRKFGFERAKEIVDSFLKNFIIPPERELRNEASKLKCRLPVSLADCYSLAISKLNSIPIYFKKKREITDNIQLFAKFEIRFIDDLPIPRSSP